MTTRFCATCGTPAEPDGRFCANCGKDLGAPQPPPVEQAPQPAALGAAATTPDATAAPVGAAPGLTAETPTAGSGAAPTAPTPIAPPAASAGGVPPAPTAPAMSGRILAGLLSGLAAIGLAAAIFFFVHGRGDSTSAAPAPAPGPAPQPAPSQPNPPAPTGGWPRNQIVDTVGAFKLVAVKRDPSLISGAITDAYIATYQTAGGIEVEFDVLAVKSKSAAMADVRGFEAFLIQKKGFKRDQPDFDVKEQGTNKVVGIAADLVKGDEEVVAWSNDKLSLISAGPKPYSWRLYNASKI